MLVGFSCDKYISVWTPWWKYGFNFFLKNMDQSLLPSPILFCQILQLCWSIYLQKATETLWVFILFYFCTTFNFQMALVFFLKNCNILICFLYSTAWWKYNSDYYQICFLQMRLQNNLNYSMCLSSPQSSYLRMELSRSGLDLYAYLAANHMWHLSQKYSTKSKPWVLLGMGQVM